MRAVPGGPGLGVGDGSHRETWLGRSKERQTSLTRWYELYNKHTGIGKNKKCKSKLWFLLSLLIYPNLQNLDKEARVQKLESHKTSQSPCSLMRLQSRNPKGSQKIWNCNLTLKYWQKLKKGRIGELNLIKSTTQTGAKF